MYGVSASLRASEQVYEVDHHAGPLHCTTTLHYCTHRTTVQHANTLLHSVQCTQDTMKRQHTARAQCSVLGRTAAECTLKVAMS